MTEWEELKETIIEMRDNGGTGTQQEVCKFLANLMDVLEKKMQPPCEEDCISRESVIEWLKNKDIIKLQKQEENARRELAALQSASSQQKGKWMIYGMDIVPHPLHCSVCGWSNHHINNLWIKEFKRCPECGTNMEVDHE